MFILHPFIKQLICVVIIALLDQGIKEVTRRSLSNSCPSGGSGPPQGRCLPPPRDDMYEEEYPPQQGY